MPLDDLGLGVGQRLGMFVRYVSQAGELFGFALGFSVQSDTSLRAVTSAALPVAAIRASRMTYLHLRRAPPLQAAQLLVARICPAWQLPARASQVAGVQLAQQVE